MKGAPRGSKQGSRVLSSQNSKDPGSWHSRTSKVQVPVISEQQGSSVLSFQNSKDLGSCHFRTFQNSKDPGSCHLRKVRIQSPVISEQYSNDPGSCHCRTKDPGSCPWSEVPGHSSLGLSGARNQKTQNQQAKFVQGHANEGGRGVGGVTLNISFCLLFLISLVKDPNIHLFRVMLMWGGGE